MSFRGIYPILPTPFFDDGQLDLPSLRRLIQYQIEAGVQGAAILGFMGESAKLSEAERRTVIETVVDEAGDALDVWVGVRALGTMGCIEQAKVAESLGVKSVFVAPLTVQNDEVLYTHYQQIHEAVSMPIMIHDFPTSFQVTLSPDLIGRLGKDGICEYIKLEDYPVGPKVTAVRKASDDTIGVFGGLGGIYFMEELQRGAIGIATGFGFPQVLVRIFELFESGQVEAAQKTFDHYASLIRYEFQPKIGLAYRKHLYHKRGIFSSPFVRHPGMHLDEETAVEFENIIQRAGLTLDSSSQQVV